MTVYNFDDIGALFDGATTTFTLQVDGSDFVFPSDYNIDITVGGVSLIEDEDFTITQSFIIFNRAPLAGDLFKSEVVDLTVQYTEIQNQPMITNGETTALLGQTLFTLAGVTGTPYNIHVHLNGIKLSTTDFSANYVGASNTLEITLVEPAAADDVLAISTSHQGGSAATVASGEIVGANLVLTLTDGTTIPIDISSLQN